MKGQEERYHLDCIERRYNNYTEVMFWGYFTYDYKEPYYIYYDETPEQKVHNEEKMERLNKEEIEVEARVEFNTREHEKERVWDEKGQK